MRGVRKAPLVVVVVEVVSLVSNSDKNFNQTVGGVPVLSVNSMRTVRNKKKTIREL